MLISTKEIEVRYAETDQMGVVYHANYLVWCELGRTQLIKDLGFNYAELEELGYVSPVLEVNLMYKKAMRYGDNATIKTWIKEYTGVQAVYGYEITNDNGEICVTGTTKHICVRKEDFRPLIMRRVLPEWHLVYEREKEK